MNCEQSIPNLAGLCTVREAAAAGLSVDDNVTMLKRIHYVKKRLYDTMVRHMCRTPEWEVKGAMSLHLWLDAEHAAALRRRVSEMREPPLHMDKVPDPQLETALDELLHADTTLELLAGIRFFRQALLEAYAEHRRLSNPLIDHPTYRVMRFVALEEQDMLDWLDPAVEALQASDSEREPTAAWVAHLAACLGQAGGLLGTEPAPPAPAQRTLRSADPFELQLVPRRDSRFSDLYNSVLSADEIYRDRARDPKERVWALFYKRLRELDVPEMQCSIVAQTPNKPWEYYLDMGRQIWDEARHSMMGEVAFLQNGVDFTKLPIRINFSLELNTLLTPEERHAILYEIEFGLMPGDTGKKYEWETSRQTGYDLAMTMHDYDWADEVLHAQIGRKWIVPQFGDVQRTIDAAKEAWGKLAERRPAYVNESPDWWDLFYGKVRDKEFVSSSEATGAK
ncbi:hypothetical protein [Paenibacillus cymbidii]|uniref:hypothetical protein n=1 Tax=Paenibacillus cymbidii TaxID=1639034 RepID=UPI0010810F22|nr:hypothetical protein [Paenibacillus cymbidii]